MIDIQGIKKDRVLRARVMKRVGEALEKLKASPVMAALERQIERRLERERENRRHPKKYFVAKRFLGGGLEAPDTAKRLSARTSG